MNQRGVGLFLLLAVQGCATRPGPPTAVYPKEPQPVRTANLGSGTFDSILPFDRPFLVRIASVAAVDSIHVQYGRYECFEEKRPENCPLRRARTVTSGLIKRDAPSFAARALPPNQALRMRFTVWKTTPGDSTKPAKLEWDTASVIGWTTAGFKDHFESDFGYARGIGAGYDGLPILLHWYVRPIRSLESLDEESVPSPGDRWAKRVNVVAGISVAKLSAEKDVSNLWSFGSPIVGLGVRSLPIPGLSIPRFFAGAIWYSQDDANPLVTRKLTKVDRVVGMTFDGDVKSVLGALYSFFGFK